MTQALANAHLGDAAARKRRLRRLGRRRNQFHFGSLDDPHCAEQPMPGDCTVPGFGPEYCQQRHVEADTLHTAYVMAEQKVELCPH